MSRWRPPAPRSSPHITPQGYAALDTELSGLWVRRTDVTRHLAAAAAEGDRSENAEYIYRKKELREIDRRIRYLQKRLPGLKVVREPPADRGKVYFGAWVTLLDESDREVEYRIVGADEFDPDRRWISLDSPVARALLGKALDDEVKVQTPAGEQYYEIVKIRYEAG
ncbi:transcription elongation factor GreB [Ectothiorhodospira shaposhnikovii]|uniref:transcription elongation factor GreB n=1 Tax=Ectothiorhodospira shaposhnikovii TaxID=1054 RepID=UPI001905BACE|nr:transcription elongation factor GreB [Ectothiorhodospira shaposhnikovii]MBK1671788.1 transcription elongation factor GreB [Ectothiorhodospira shaposhnikovii]